jgi:hypothetical protein
MADDPEKERAKLTHLVGECIMAWSGVEKSLTVLYCECLGVTTFGLIGPEFWLHTWIFDSVISIDARLDMIEAALGFQRGKLDTDPAFANSPWRPVFDRWSPMRAKIRKRYNKRNEIAHSEIVATDTDGLRLKPYPTLSSMWGTGTLLDAGQLEERRGKFVELGFEIMKFKTDLMLVREPHSGLVPPNRNIDPEVGAD